MKNGKWFVLSVLLVSCVLLFNSAGLSFAQEDTGLQIKLLRLKPAVALIYTRIEAQISTKIFGQVVFKPFESIGTGLIISPDGYLITNGHVVAAYQGADEYNVGSYFYNQLNPAVAKKIKKDNLLDEIKLQKKLYVILSNGEDFVAEIKQFSPPITPQAGKSSVTTRSYNMSTETGKDIAIVKIDARNLPTVPLGDSGNVQLGEQIYVIGYPGVVLTHDYLSKKTSTDSTVTMGHISGSKLDVKGTPVIQTDASLTWGNSGGPAFNSKGEVIGIATFISISQNLGSQQAIQGFNFLVPINTAKEFVRSAGVDLNAESLFNKLWNDALELYSIPDYKKTLSKIDEVNRLMPNQPDVKKLQLSAQEKISTQKSAFPLVPIMIAVLGALIVGGIVLIVILRGKGKKTPSPVSTPSTPAQQTKAAMPSSSLKCTEGPLAGRSFPITPSGIKIGRDPNKNQVVVDIDGVSREHAWVGMENDKVIVKDLNSLNGTYLNSTDTDRIKSEPLKDGDVIIIGKGRFAVLSYKAA